MSFLKEHNVDLIDVKVQDAKTFGAVISDRLEKIKVNYLITLVFSIMSRKALARMKAKI